MKRIRNQLKACAGLEEEKDRISQTTKSKQSNLEEACWPELEIFRHPSNATNFKSKVSSLKYRVRLILGCHLYQIWYICIYSETTPLRSDRPPYSDQTTCPQFTLL